jgi:hypothetical protein
MKKLLCVFTFLFLNLGIVQFTYGIPPSDQSIPGATQQVAASVNSIPEHGTSPVNLPQTGAKTSYAKGDDGDLKRGVAWPNPRFTVKNDCITDNLTGLMWAKNANLANGAKDWMQALDYAGNLTLCGYSDWRIPNVNEIETLINAEHPNEAIGLNGEGFVNVQPDSYWSSTTFDDNRSYAWIIGMQYGNVGNSKKVKGNYVWPVRAGQ